MVDSRELDRQYRLARQTLAMHSFLRDSYATRVLALRCVLLAGSAVFCATAFAGDDLFAWMGVSARAGRYVLRSASVMSFVVTLLMLVLGWDAAATRHGDAAKRFSQVVAEFRRFRDSPDAADAPTFAELNATYWDACHETVPIPNRLHPRLKSRYLLSIEVGRILDEVPGCPPFVVRWVLRLRGIKDGFRRAGNAKIGQGAKAKESEAFVGGALAGPLSQREGGGTSEGVRP